MLVAGLTLGGAHAAEPPRLVLQITIDQLRGDMIARHGAQFGPGGIRRLLDDGRYFANAHYRTSNTFTAAGHAVLVTGADTAQHGMIANEWYDRASGKVIPSVFDPKSPVVGEPAKPGAGLSPANLQSTTLGDEVVAAGRGARAFAVAGKDRSAIITGGHLGRAFWWSEASGRFVSSAYYGEALPAWATAWNDAKPLERYRALTWQPSEGNVAAAENKHARAPQSLGRSFPHPLLAKSDALFFGAFKFTPFLDEVTLAFARELIAQERVGQGTATDYLSISFSGHDYIGHAFGPESPEYTDSLRRLDRGLAALFRFIDERVGWQRVLVVLAADHGMDDIPEARQGAGIAAGRLYPEKLRAAANLALRQRLAIADDLVVSVVPPGFYLDLAKLDALKFERRVVENALAEHVRGQPGVAHAFTRSALLEGQVPRSELGEKVQRGFHPQRSGDVVMVQEQFWYMYPDPEQFAAMHGSPYTYDTFVPVMICGPGVGRGVSYAPVSPAQIAPTLAALLGIKPPSGCATSELLPGVKE